MNTTNYTDAQLDQIQLELNAIGLSASNNNDNFLYKEFNKELDIVTQVLGNWIAKDGKAIRLQRQDSKETKSYSNELAVKITDLDRLAKVIFSSIIKATNTIHDQPNGKSDNGNPHFQMIINRQILIITLPIFDVNYNNSDYPIKTRLTFWNKVLHNILLEIPHCFEIYKGKSTGPNDSGYWLIRNTKEMETRLDSSGANVKLVNYVPLIVPPLPWTNAKEGGYYTKELQRSAPLSRHHDVIPQPVLDAVNKIQAVPFIISKDGLKIAEKYIKEQSLILNKLKEQRKQIRKERVELLKELKPTAKE
jgi:hypothetical protein